MQLAGTLYGAYGPNGLFSIVDRLLVQDLVDTVAERLVYLSSLAEPSEITRAEAPAADHELADLAVLQVADLASGSAADGGPSPSTI